MKKVVNFFGLIGLGVFLFAVFASGAFTLNRSGNVEIDKKLLMNGVVDGLTPYAETMDKYNRRKKP